MAVLISGVEKNSIAFDAGIKKGDTLVSVDGHEINDLLDYGFYTKTDKLSLLIKLKKGGEELIDVEKDEDEELGLLFQSFLMDEQHSCQNDCIFCFINQLPKGLRETLYFKDDDERLSFLFGNYITLTNMSDEEIERIIEMKISPINISVHTTNEKLRCEMMHNRFAGEKLKYLYRLAEAGVEINCQIVLCRGVNDGDELRATLDKLTSLYPSVRSIACVPAGLTAHREGLPKLTPYDGEAAKEVLSIIDDYNSINKEKYGVNLVYPADEFLLLAGREIPSAEYYDDFLQIENGVGMLRKFTDEFNSEAEKLELNEAEKTIGIATGEAAAGTISALVESLKTKRPKLSCTVHTIKNEFFGGNVIVSGLVTATDIIKQLKSKGLHGDKLLIPRDMLRREGDMFLDSITLDELEKSLNIVVEPICGGEELVWALTDEE